MRTCTQSHWSFLRLIHTNQIKERVKLKMNVGRNSVRMSHLDTKYSKSERECESYIGLWCVLRKCNVLLTLTGNQLLTKILLLRSLFSVKSSSLSLSHHVNCATYFTGELFLKIHQSVDLGRYLEFQHTILMEWLWFWVRPNPRISLLPPFSHCNWTLLETNQVQRPSILALEAQWILWFLSVVISSLNCN